MSFIVNRFKAWRQGAVTGAGFTENNIKMLGYLLAPFLAGWTGVKYLTPPELYDMYVGLLLIGWLLWCVLLWAWAKSDAGNYICFPQSQWRFPDGSCRTFDLKIPPDSWEKVINFPNGDKGYYVEFSNTYLVDLLNLPFPLIFDKAYWIIPALWDTAFQRRAFGEFFHKGVYVQKPDCENISVYVTHYEPTEQGNIPVCIINDCSITYQRTLKNAKRMSIGQVAKLNSVLLAYSKERTKRLSLLSHTSFLEDRVTIAEGEASTDFKKSADERLESVRKRHGTIMETQESLFTRIFKLKNIAIAMVIIAIVILVGRFFFRLW